MTQLPGGRSARARVDAVRSRWLRVGSLAAALVLVGCGSTTAQSPFEQDEQSVAAAPHEVVQARQQAGLPDCSSLVHGSGSPSDKASSGSSGRRLPNLALGCLGADQQVNLQHLAGGRPLVINVWAQWCGPCRQEAPMLASASRQLADRVQFVGIDMSDPKPLLAVDFAHGAGWTYPQLVDPDGLVRRPPLNVPGLPQTLLVDGSGTIVHVVSGPLESEQQLTDLVASKLGIHR